MKGAQRRIFYGIVLLSMLLSALYLALRRGAGLEAFVFDGGGNLIGDFVNNLHYPTHEGGPYFDSCWASFPPLAYTVYYLINVCITRAIYPFEVMVYMAITALSCMLMLGAVERIFRRWRPGGFRPGEPLALCVCLLLSGVTVYTIERGNSALNVMVMILWAFALLAGLPMALVRATVMYSVLVVSELLQRGYSAVNSLATAALVILLVWPQALMDVSFQLSFLSMAALLLLLPLLTPRGHSLAGRLLTTWVTVPVSAQVAVLPLVAYYFHTVAAYFLVANAVAVPASFVILCAALAFFLLPFEGVQTLLGHVLDITTHTMNTLLAAIAQWPGAAIHYAPSPTGVALTYGGLVLTVAALATRRRAYVYALTACFTLAVCAGLADSVVFQHTGQRMTYALLQSEAGGAGVGSLVLGELLSHWYLILVAIAMAFAMWKLYTAYRTKAYYRLVRYYIWQLALIICAAPLVVAGMKGSFNVSGQHLEIEDASRYVNKQI